MSLKITKRKIDVDLEKSIIINCITNTQFLKETAHILKAEYFDIPYSQTVYRWIYDYFLKYDEAPNRYIQDIYDVKKEDLDESEAELIAHFLKDISDSYDEKINVDFCADKAIEYAISKGLAQNAKDTLALLKLGRVKDAEEKHIGYKKIAKITSNWVNPNDEKYAKSVFETQESDILIQFPGAFGELIGPLERGWFISSIGEAKIGKSFFLHEIRTLGLFQGLKVVEINLEMKSKQLSKRYYQRISGYGKAEENIKYPVFDCHKNQDGSCNKPERINEISLLDEDGMKKDYEQSDKEYKPCTACRGTNAFEQTTWFAEDTCEALTFKNIQSKIKAHKKMYGDNYRLITYPRFRATLDDVERDLDLLAFTEGFYPDIIIYDYADATKPKGYSKEGRNGINDIWMGLAGMAPERNVLLATTSHVNIRRIEGKRKTNASDISDDTRKLNHVDLMFSHSSSEEEKRHGIIRCSVEEHRHKFFDPSKEVVVTRHLNTGQALLDSEFKQERGNVE